MPAAAPPASLDWLTGFEQIRGNDAGRWTSSDVAAPKILLHRTEGSSIAGAVGAYTTNNSWPHLTVDIRRRRKVQHCRLGAPARALRNTSAGGETNRDRYVYQIEVVGFSKDSPADSDADLTWFAREVLEPLAAATGTPLATHVTWFGLDAGFTLATTTAPQRLTRAAWDAYAGLLAHQHAPENTHWDVGAFRIAFTLAATSGATTNPEDLTVADIAALNAKLDALQTKVDTLLATTPKRAAPVRGPDKRVWLITDEGRWYVPDIETLDVLIFLGQAHGYGSKGPAVVTEDFLDGIPVLS